MRVGPLGCLSLLAAASFGWAIGRLPDLLDGVRRDLAAAGDGGPVQLAVATIPERAAVIAPALARPPTPTLPRREVSAAAQPSSPASPVPHRGPAPAREPDPGWRESPAAVAAADASAELGLAALTAAAWPGLGLTEQPAIVGLLAPTPANASLGAPAPATGFTLATAAYADLARGDRRAAAAHFAAALAADPAAENAALWRRSLRQLNRRWSSETYVIMRAGGTAGLGTTPVLGGGQGGRSFGYTPMPLADRPLYLVFRTIGARTDGLRLDGEADSEQAAVGMRWQAARGMTVSVERLFALTEGGRSAWTVRLAGGGTRRFGRLIADAYAEVGIVGMRRADVVAGAQARLFRSVERPGLRFETGVGIWSGIQRAGSIVDRVDAGPTVSLVTDSLHLRASLDYRFRLIGNAAPGSGPVLTVSRAF